MRSLRRVRRSATPWTGARQAPLSMGFSRQEHRSGCQVLPQKQRGPAVCAAQGTLFRALRWPMWEKTLKQRGCVHTCDRLTRMTDSHRCVQKHRIANQLDSNRELKRLLTVKTEEKHGGHLATVPCRAAERGISASWGSGPARGVIGPRGPPVTQTLASAALPLGS